MKKIEKAAMNRPPERDDKDSNFVSQYKATFRSFKDDESLFRKPNVKQLCLFDDENEAI